MCVFSYNETELRGELRITAFKINIIFRSE